MENATPSKTYFAVYEPPPNDRYPIAIFRDYPAAHNWRDTYCGDGSIEELDNEFLS